MLMVRARLAFLALAIFAAPASAQAVNGSSLVAPSTPAVDAPTADVAAGPRVATLRSAAHHAESTGPLRMMAATHAGMGQAKAMMIVGAAAFVAGAIIGDTPGTIMMVGGAAVGLVGLYQYLQ
jgi:hypothetical protein